jgi:hypothetical protein
VKSSCLLTLCLERTGAGVGLSLLLHFLVTGGGEGSVAPLPFCGMEIAYISDTVTKLLEVSYGWFQCLQAGAD